MAIVRYLIYLTLASLCVSEPAVEQKTEDAQDSEEPPEGYYAFVESPNATPPRVRPPPYRQVAAECSPAGERAHVSANNLCGDLNRGVIPRNPLGQNPNGEPYPFELIRNHTLRFLSRTLPVLRADDALPRVAHVTQPQDGYHDHNDHHNHHHDHDEDHLQHNRLEDRARRSLSSTTQDTQAKGAREARSFQEVPSSQLSVEHRADSRGFCDGGGVFCMLYRAINGESSGPERREDPGVVPHGGPAGHGGSAGPGVPGGPPRYEGPPTPCPARVEYATPVFARNYQGVWRYVVQIPYEGYFTQTVEVTRCLRARCHYLDGGCLSSPRWLSLLVAEMHYPPEYQQTNKRLGEGDTTEKPPHCDGHDELGCYQVRLYYDWFLVPGSCKCWRPDYFARYVRRAHTDL